MLTANHTCWSLPGVEYPSADACLAAVRKQGPQYLGRGLKDVGGFFVDALNPDELLLFPPDDVCHGVIRSAAERTAELTDTWAAGFPLQALAANDLALARRAAREVGAAIDGYVQAPLPDEYNELEAAFAEARVRELEIVYAAARAVAALLSGDDLDMRRAAGRLALKSEVTS